MTGLPGVVLADEGEPPATPRHAATVALLRDGGAGADGGGGIEVFLLHRVRGMAFAGGMTVFPGGGVDARDGEEGPAWAGPDAAWWAGRFGCDVPLARSLVCAAVRETFEECGVLLAGPTADTVVPDSSRYHAVRRALVDREVSLTGFLAEEGLVLRADLLRPWSTWVTPPEEPRRYDTKFFVAAMPAGQQADGATSEATGAGWQTPAQAQADAREGRRALMTPTWTTLDEVAAHADVAAVLAAERPLVPVRPRVVRRDGQVAVAMPGDDDYPAVHPDDVAPA
ncbi:NUDIX domain-containing protein [Rhodococcus aerolatus]